MTDKLKSGVFALEIHTISTLQNILYKTREEAEKACAGLTRALSEALAYRNQDQGTYIVESETGPTAFVLKYVVSARVLDKDKWAEISAPLNEVNKQTLVEWENEKIQLWKDAGYFKDESVGVPE